MCGAPYIVMFLAPQRDGVVRGCGRVRCCGVVRWGIVVFAQPGPDSIAGVTTLVARVYTSPPTHREHLQIVSVLFYFYFILVVSCGINGFIYSHVVAGTP